MDDQQGRARLQVPLDFLELGRALKVAEEAAAGGADILEAGTPLIKSVGLEGGRRLRAQFPNLTIAAGVSDPLTRAKEGAALGVDFVGVHTAIDMQMRGADPFSLLRDVVEAAPVEECVAGCIPSENAARAVAAGGSGGV